jgi:hypothetical protein
LVHFDLTGEGIEGQSELIDAISNDRLVLSEN